MQFEEEFFTNIANYCRNEGESLYYLINDVNAYMKLHNHEYYSGLPQEKQDYFCSPALNFCIDYSLTRNLSAAEKSYDTTKLAVCYVYCCDYYFDTKEKKYRDYADENLELLRKRFSAPYKTRFERILGSFETYWHCLEMLRKNLSHGNRVFSVQAVKRYLYLRSSNTRLYSLIAEQYGHKTEPAGFFSAIKRLLYYNMIIDDMHNDILDIEKDQLSGDPNMFIMLSTAGKSKQSALLDPREILQISVGRNREFFMETLEDLSSKVREMDSQYPIIDVLQQFYFEKEETVRRVTFGL